MIELTDGIRWIDIEKNTNIFRNFTNLLLIAGIGIYVKYHSPTVIYRNNFRLQAWPSLIHDMIFSDWLISNQKIPIG